MGVRPACLLELSSVEPHRRDDIQRASTRRCRWLLSLFQGADKEEGGRDWQNRTTVPFYGIKCQDQRQLKMDKLREDTQGDSLSLIKMH